MPADRFFVDTNLLLYWVDTKSPDKHALASRWLDHLWARNCGRVSWQVLNEFYVNALRKFKLPVRDARGAVETLAQWSPVGFSLGLVHRAWHWQDHAGVASWDSLILAAAEFAECRYLLSEDFQADRKFGGVQVINPFQQTPGQYGLE